MLIAIVIDRYAQVKLMLSGQETFWAQLAELFESYRKRGKGGGWGGRSVGKVWRVRCSRVRAKSSDAWKGTGAVLGECFNVALQGVA